MIYKKLQTTSEKLFTAANTVNKYGDKLHTANDTFGRFGPGYAPLNRDVQAHIYALVMDMDSDSEEIRDDYFNDYNEEIRDSYITNYEKDTTPPTSPLQYPLPADKSRQPPQTTSRCVAISTPKRQPSFTKEGMMQILEKSTIPQIMWKYYNEPPETWNYNDRDETGLLHNGVKSILMMNSLPNVIPWWLHEPLSFGETMSVDRLIELKLK